MKRNVYLMYAISLLQGMVFYASIATLYRQAAGLTVWQIALIESISFALSLLCEVPWGVIADRVGYRRVMIICGVLFFVSKLVFWQARDFAGFLIERILLAVVIAGLSGVDTGILYLSCPQERAHRAFSICEGLGTAGLLLSAAVCSRIDMAHYRLTGLLTVIPYGIAAVLCFFLTEVRPEVSERRSPAIFRNCLAQLLHNRRLMCLVVSGALIAQVQQALTVFYNQLQYQRAGMTTAAISAVYIVVSLVGLLGVFSARLTARLRPRRSGVMLTAAAFAACVLLTLTDSAVLSVGGVMLVNVACSLYSPLQKTLENEAITSPDRATALSMNALLADLLTVGTGLVYGAIADASVSAAMGFGAVLSIAALGFFLGGSRKRA